MLLKTHIILIALLGTVWFGVECAKKRKNKQILPSEICDLKKMDRSAEIVFVFGRRDVYLPINTKKMVPHCKEEKEAEEFVKKYARTCLKLFPRQLVGVILLGASNVIRTRCKTEGTKEYLSHYSCIKNSLDSLHNCMDQLVVSLQEIKKKPSNERIPLACCTFARYIHCSGHPIKKYCKDDKTADDYIINKMIKGYASEVLDLACSGYPWGGEKCNSLELPDGGFKEGDNELVVYKNVTDKPQSLLPPFIEVFSQD